MAVITPRLDSLPDAQKRLWPKLAPASNLGFVLYGGTALAMRFAHRNSIDFDFFTSQTFSESDLKGMLPWLNFCHIIQKGDNAYSYITEEKVQITFLGGFSFGRLGDPDIDAATGLQIASAQDIFALKIGAIHGRIALKDFLDIAELIRQNFPLEAALIGAQTLIKGMLPPQFSIQALTWYDDPSLSCLSQKDRETIINACAAVNLDSLYEKKLQLSGETLYDAEQMKLFITKQQENQCI